MNNKTNMPIIKKHIQNTLRTTIGLSLFFLLALSSRCFALNFPLPTNGNTIFGHPQTAIVQNGEDFSDVALRFKIGYYEIFESNPGIDPDTPPNGSVLVIPTQYILPPELKSNMILINLAEMRLYFIPQGQKTVYVFPVGIGKSGWDTPMGPTKIISKIKHPSWTVPKSIKEFRASKGDILPDVVPAGPDNPLGDYALRLSYHNYLIHGTNLPAGVGRRSSAGCIRLYDDNIETLFNLVKVGTKVLIINEPYKSGWLNGKFYLEAHMPLLEQRLAKKNGDMSSVIKAINQAEPKNRLAKVNWKRSFKVARQHLTIPRIIGRTSAYKQLPIRN